MGRTFLACSLFVTLVSGSLATGADPSDWEEMKRRWNDLTPAERADYEERQRRWLAEQGLTTEPGKTAGDACTQARFEITDLPFADRNSTRGVCSADPPLAESVFCSRDADCPQGATCSNRIDHVNLSFSGVCAFGGTQMTATGFGPDVFYRIQVNERCHLRVSMQPATRDLALYVVQNCFSPARTCRGVSDGGQSGVPEEVTFLARPTESYYIIVDGFAGHSDDFELTVEEVSLQGAPLVGCMLVPVELQRFTVE